jgi:hypothetical protein
VTTPDADINTPGRFETPWEGNLLPLLIANTWGHYGEHVEDVRRYVEGLAP